MIVARPVRGTDRALDQAHTTVPKSPRVRTAPNTASGTETAEAMKLVRASAGEETRMGLVLLSVMRRDHSLPTPPIWG